MDTIKSAFLGTGHYSVTTTERELLLQAAQESLQQKAGYMPRKMPDTPPTPVEQRGALLTLPPAGSEWQEVDALAAWCAGYAWVCGSAPFWRLRRALDKESTWEYGDIDLFCHSEETYDTLRGLFKSDANCEIEDKPYSSTITGMGIVTPDSGRIWLNTPVNLVKPPPDVDWAHPAPILSKFDLSICAVCMIEPCALYTMYEPSIYMTYTGHSLSPLSTMQRIFKYMRRRFEPDVNFWYDIAADPRMERVMQMCKELHRLESPLSVLEDIAAAMQEDLDTWDDAHFLELENGDLDDLANPFY